MTQTEKSQHITAESVIHTCLLNLIDDWNIEIELSNINYEIWMLQF